MLNSSIMPNSVFGLFLSLTALALAVFASSQCNFGFGSRCCPVVGGHGREAVRYGTVCVPPSMTHVRRLIPRPPPLWTGVRFPSMPQPLRTWEHQTWWRKPRVTSATTGARYHRNINNISLGISNKSYHGLKKSFLSYKPVRILVILM